MVDNVPTQPKNGGSRTNRKKQSIIHIDQGKPWQACFQGEMETDPIEEPVVDWEWNLLGGWEGAEWEDCKNIYTDCLVDGLVSSKVHINVPSRYDLPFGRRFWVTARRFLYNFTSIPTSHVIFLAGGPGADGQSVLDQVQRYVREGQGAVAGYIIDHRGLGGSGAINPDHLPWAGIIDNFKKICFNAPFNVKDLTMENAALDIGMLAFAIKRDPLWQNGARLVLHGFSYGARLAHHSVQLLPNLFEAAVLAGIPNLPGFSLSTLKGMVKHCQRDPFCRLSMGPNVRKNFKLASRAVISTSFNYCCDVFQLRLFNGPLVGTLGERAVALGGIVRQMISGKCNYFPHTSSSLPIQLLFPLLKATHDCNNPQIYERKVLEPFIDFINCSRAEKSSYYNQGDNHYAVESFVNQVVQTETRYQDFIAGYPAPPPDYVELHPEFFYAKSYYHNWYPVKESFRGRHLSTEKPIITPKTQVFIAASLMDFNTTYYPAWELYNTIVSPDKRWLLFLHRPHDGYEGECMGLFVTEAIYGLESFDYTTCFRLEDDSHVLDWTFSQVPNFAHIWNHVGYRLTSSTFPSIFYTLHHHHYHTTTTLPFWGQVRPESELASLYLDPQIIMPKHQLIEPNSKGQENLNYYDCKVKKGSSPHTTRQYSFIDNQPKGSPLPLRHFKKVKGLASSFYNSSSLSLLHIPSTNIIIMMTSRQLKLKGGLVQSRPSLNHNLSFLKPPQVNFPLANTFSEHFISLSLITFILVTIYFIWQWRGR